MTQNRILVTGGAGFIGSHLCQKLVDRGDDVICLDNFFTSQKHNVMHLIKKPNFELIRHDVTQPFRFEVDQIYNLACPASPVHYQHNPIATLKVSVLGATHCAGLAKRTGARLLQASTSEVYGDPNVHPQKENYWGNVNPIGTRACYDEGKRAAETLLFDYIRKHKLDIRIARIFNTYGPNMHPKDGRVVSNFIVQALRGEPLTVYGDGSQSRSFCYVDDLVRGLMSLMDLPNKPKSPINIGNPKEFTIRELAVKILSIIGLNSSIVHKKMPSDDPKQRQPDITSAKKLLRWEPKVNLDEGLLKTIEYFKGVDIYSQRPPTPKIKQT